MKKEHTSENTRDNLVITNICQTLQDTDTMEHTVHHVLGLNMSHVVHHTKVMIRTHFDTQQETQYGQAKLAN